ncbi:hypothetical protein SAMN05443572_10670 [Myxococcus fulvus]|uniref:Uncharacterized protein n=1 Tax=Myxococcus fulvus TaxID=33 RepID=A0ABY1CMG8_MYXFU|nr:hypothetical protein SAMN05443572_10670 [Myxococcus fulvus]
MLVLAVSVGRFTGLRLRDAVSVEPVGSRRST